MSHHHTILAQLVCLQCTEGGMSLTESSMWPSVINNTLLYDVSFSHEYYLIVPCYNVELINAAFKGRNKSSKSLSWSALDTMRSSAVRTANNTDIWVDDRELFLNYFSSYARKQTLSKKISSKKSKFENKFQKGIFFSS